MAAQLTLYSFAATFFAIVPVAVAGTGGQSSLSSAVATITEAELHGHVEVLADDIYEGRAAGSRGGHAAAKYVIDQLEAAGLAEGEPGGVQVQQFNNNCRNLLIALPGEDAAIGAETIVVGAHYDHVGYGKPSNSFGPIGKIHNGADDNASGTAVLLEVIEALTTSGVKTRRTLLFAFWDSEENGLLGSGFWMRNPTTTRSNVKMNVTIDMVGRLRNDRLELLGSRSGYGLRRLFSGSVAEPLWLDFGWDIRSNSDHWPFLNSGIPALILHTGIHSDYHRPSDDIEKINAEGMQKVAQYLLKALVQAANADRLPSFRSAFRRETNSMRRNLEQPLPEASLAAWPSRQPRPQIGIAWREDESEPGSVFLTRVVQGSPAAEAGLAVHDRIYEIDQHSFTDGTALLRAIHEKLRNGAPAIRFLIERHGRLKVFTVDLSVKESSPSAAGPEPMELR